MRPNAVPGTASAVFRAALALCPAGFRREYGLAMRADFERAYTEEKAIHGLLGAATYALGATGDLFLTALREYAAMLVRDLVYALRTLRKAPSFTVVVVATLGIAIGANAAVFSIVRATVLAPIPYVQPERLVAIESRRNGAQFAFSLPDFADVIRQSSDTLNVASAFYTTSSTMTGRGVPRRLNRTESTAGLFETLGTRMELGRAGTSRDAARGAARTVVISNALWRSTFASDVRAIGSVVQLNGEPFRIIGVAPPGFVQPKMRQGFAHTDLWTLLPVDGSGTQFANRDYHGFEAVGRLAPGVSIAQFRTSLERIAADLRRRNAAQGAVVRLDAVPLTDSLVGSIRPLSFALFVAVGAVVLVACANVANLFLSRAASRGREFSVRLAVGASRGRIVVQVLVEALVLSFAGGAAGVGIAYRIVAAFVALRPAHIPRANLVAVDGASVVYTLGLIAFCTIAAGLAPALVSTRRDVAFELKSAGRGGDAHRGARARSALVASEIAMTLALVVAAGLVVRSFIALTSQPLGFEPRGVTVVGPVDLPDARYGVDARREAFMSRLARRVATLPGVQQASWALSAPFASDRMNVAFNVPGRSVPKGREPDAGLGVVGARFFRAISATVLAGRAFDDGDRFTSQPVAIVDATFAKKYFPGQPAVGRWIVPSFNLAPTSPPVRRIVGVVADMRSSYNLPHEPTIYLPSAQAPMSGSSLIVSSATNADPGPSVAAAVSDLDPLLPIPERVALSSMLARDVAVQRLSVVALSTLAIIALALSIAGVFAVVTYGVTQRTHEFGVRMALGADARQIVRTVLGAAMRLALGGIALGLVVAAATTRFLTDQLYDTQPLDPEIFAGVTALLLVAALVAAFMPARRATLVDPVVALRYE